MVSQSTAGQRCFSLVVGWSRKEPQGHCFSFELSCVHDHILIGTQQAKCVQVLHEGPGEREHVRNGSVTKKCPWPISVLITELTFLPGVSIPEACSGDIYGA